MKTALKTTLIVAVTLAGSITLAAAQQAGGSTNGGNGGDGGRGGGGKGGTTALDLRSAAAACVPGQTCRPKPRLVRTKPNGECSCTYTRYTDDEGYYYKKICIRFDGVTGRQLRCAF